MVEMKTVIPKIDENTWRRLVDIQSAGKEKRHEPRADGRDDRDS